jgi:hypothetical protein
MAERVYRVLLLEDDHRVLDRVRDRLSAVRHEAAGHSWWLELKPVHICVARSAGAYTFTRQTLEDIVKSVREGVDLVVVDYGYVHAEAWSEARAQAAAAGRMKVTREDVRGRILTAEDLASALREHIATEGMSKDVRTSVESTFFAAGRRTAALLYSYTSADLYDVYASVDARKNRTQNVFPALSITAVDTKSELYNREEFDWPASPSKHDPTYYSFLLSGLLVLLVRERFLRHLLALAEAPQYLRVRRSLKSVSLIVAFGAAFGAVGQWIGDRILAFAATPAYGPLLIFSMFAAALTVIAGLTLPVLFERLMLALLRPEEPPAGKSSGWEQ